VKISFALIRFLLAGSSLPAVARVLPRLGSIMLSVFKLTYYIWW